MSMTIATAAEALRKAAPASVGQASSVTASALLQGARGNSGVILSLLFRGLSKALKGMETADAAAFAAAMQEGMCGFPDKLVIFTYDQYVVSLYGDEELVNTFRDKFTATYSDSTIAYDEAIL